MRVSHLSHKSRCRDIDESLAESAQEPAAKEHAPVEGRGLNACANHDEQAAGQDAPAPAEVIAEWAYEREGAEAADVEDGENQAGGGAGSLTRTRERNGLSVLIIISG